MGKLVLSSGVILTVIALMACIPINTEPGRGKSQSVPVPRVNTRTVGPEVVPGVDELNAFFPQAGRYALKEDEREQLRIRMYKRYDAGFYEPEYPAQLTGNLNRLLKNAQTEDGLTYEEIQDEFINDAKRGLATMPDRVLENLRWVAGNSIVLTVETLQRQEAYRSAGMDVPMLQKSLEKMRTLRRMVVDEQERRKENGIVIE